MILELLVHKLPFERPVLVLTSYGWSEIASRKITEILSKGGYKVVESILYRGYPKPSDEEKIRKAVDKLLKELR